MAGSGHDNESSTSPTHHCPFGGSCAGRCILRVVYERAGACLAVVRWCVGVVLQLSGSLQMDVRHTFLWHAMSILFAVCRRLGISVGFLAANKGR